MTSSLPDPQSSFASCTTDEHCLTCGDVAVPMTVVSADGADAVCEDEESRRDEVAIDLVAPVRAGERLLVHGGVAIARVEEER